MLAQKPYTRFFSRIEELAKPSAEAGPDAEAGPVAEAGPSQSFHESPTLKVKLNFKKKNGKKIVSKRL